MNLWMAGAVSGLIAVGAGAFGAHALRARVEPALLQAFETGARYQMFHALALLAMGMAPAPPGRPVAWAGRLFVAGTVLFSGSLYALALTGVRMWGAVTPLGGVFLMAGWLALALGSRRSS
ncbi:MAG: DUF423 domain-containing protein [Candidatus Eisenbacteria bacterium]|nr:DUF423 domain-containing protein [Candidatus Eisenbacteria bacterium]